MTSASPRTAKFRASPIAIWSALIAVYLIWGSTYLAIRWAVESTPPFLMAAVRFIVSGGALFAARRVAGDPAPSALEWRNTAIIGIFLLLGGNGGVVWAEQFVPSALAALLVATVPLWMALLDALLNNERPNAAATIGILLGFTGVVLLIESPWSAAETVNGYGPAALLIASLSWAIGSLYGRNASLPPSQLLGTGMQMSTGGIALLVVSLAAGEWRHFDPAAVSQRSALALVYLTVVGSSAFVAYVWLLRVAPTPLVSTYAYVNPLVAVFLGYFLAGEQLTPRILVAALVIILSVVLVTVPKKPQYVKHE